MEDEKMDGLPNDVFAVAESLDEALHAALGLQQLMDGLLAGADYEPLGAEGFAALQELHSKEIVELHAASKALEEVTKRLKG